MEGDPRNPRVSLLKKYDIPIDHLSYEYVEKCSNKKDLERIVRILRSGEEGSYPDLLKVAEERLRLFAPESRVLRVETPILTKECLTQEEWNTVEEELMSWEQEMKAMDKSLDFEKSRAGIVGNKNMPNVRKGIQPKLKKEKAKEVTVKKQSRIRSGDYNAWEKFDVDKELLKIDVEEERKIEENEKKRREAKKLQEKKKIDIEVIDKENYSSMEQQVLANQAKDRGNECYKFGDLESALKYYEISIRLHPTIHAYNNRAMTYLKLQQYENTIKDCNKVLEMEKNNIKALLRRATAYQNLSNNNETNNYDQLALQDLYEIVLMEPNNKAAQADLQKLKKKLNVEDTGKKFRMKISEETESKENSKESDAKSLSGLDYNYISSEKLPLTYYGPSTSSFQCEPYSMMHRALSGSSIPGLVLCKCNSSRTKQNPLCQKCGEAMCTPKFTKARKPSRDVAAQKNEEVKDQLSEKRTSELSQFDAHFSQITNETGNEWKNNNNSAKSNSESAEANETQKRQIDFVGFKNKMDNDANNNYQSHIVPGLDKGSTSIEGVPKKQIDAVEKPLENDKTSFNVEKQDSSREARKEIIENNVKAVEAQKKASGNDTLKEVGFDCSNGNDATVTANSSRKADDDIQTSKKSKHKKKKSKDQKDSKVARKHLEPLIIEPVKVVHAAKYLQPTSVEPKVRSEAPVESQQETNVSSTSHYKAFVPNRKCYSSESNRMTSSRAASYPASKQMPEQVVNSYSSLEGNKENISECQCNRNIGNGGKEDGGEEAKKDMVDSPFEFIKTWEELKKFDKSYTKRAEIIRRIRPSDLGKVIGIKLDSDMLSCFLECLLRHLVETDPKRVIELLNQLPKIPRYGLVSMFLADTDKKKMKKLIETAEGKGFKLDEDVKKNLSISS